MTELHSEDVKEAVINELLKLAPGVTIYKEAKNTLNYPHFFVQQINVVDTEERKSYHYLDYSINIRYRVADDPSTDLRLQQNLDSMLLKLLSGFNIIEFDGEKIRCTEKSCEKIDGVLQFFFNARIQAKLVDLNDEKIKQGKLSTEVNINGQN